MMKKILIVDDSPIILRTMNMFLHEKYEVIVSPSAFKGLPLARTEQPDLILLDYDMPETDGVEFFKQLKTYPETAQIPVLFLTGVSDKERIMEALQCHPAGYILKPPVKEKLLKTIDDLLLG